MFPVAINQARLSEDLAHNSPAARAQAQAAAERFARRGIARVTLHPCRAGDDQAPLPGCVKTYLPDVNGAWGMVFALRADTDRGVYLEYLAFGQRHPRRATALSVYDVAARRRARL